MLRLRAMGRRERSATYGAIWRIEPPGMYVPGGGQLIVLRIIKILTVLSSQVLAARHQYNALGRALICKLDDFCAVLNAKCLGTYKCVVFTVQTARFFTHSLRVMVPSYACRQPDYLLQVVLHIRVERTIEQTG